MTEPMVSPVRSAPKAAAGLFHAPLAQLRRIGLTAALVEQALAWPAEPGACLARVVEVQRDRVTLHDGQDLQPARLWPGLHLRLQQAGQNLTVGDWVRAAPGDSPDPDLWAMDRLPVQRLLERRDPHGRRQTLASHVDTALLVMACGRDFNLRRLDRYLALVRLAGVQPVVVLSQADQHPDPARRLAELQAHAPGLPAIALDGRQASAVQVLAPWLGEGQTLVMLGSSGAGKSTLTNSLTGAEPDDAGWQHTGAVRQQDGRGRHTTTHRVLRTCAAGACIIDTPGLRGLQLDADAGAVSSAFDDVQRWAGQCRFRNCLHQGEPGCAVRDHVAATRLTSYHKLLREAARETENWQDRRAQLSEWKSRSRQARAAMSAKRPGRADG